MGVFFVVGVGPGDPEMLTLKARNILLSVDVIIAPKTAEQKESLALSVVQEFTGGKDIREFVFPMSHNKELLNKSWDDATDAVTDMLTCQKDVALITLGDPTVYSTGMYVYKQVIRKGFEAQLISGVPSFCAAAAAAGISLAENKQTIAVIPSAYGIDILPSLKNFDNIILMKPPKDSTLLKELTDSFGSVTAVSRCGLEGQSITRGLPDNHLDYFTTIILKKDTE